MKRYGMCRCGQSEESGLCQFSKIVYEYLTIHSAVTILGIHVYTN